MPRTSAPRASKKKVPFQDRISQLTVHQATRLLGEDGEKLLRAGGKFLFKDPDEDFYLCGDLLRIRVSDPALADGHALVVITQMAGRKQELHLRCDHCETPCVHGGAAVNFLMDNKSYFGLSAAPDESVPFELLTPEELHQRAMAERRQRARDERMSLKTHTPETPWGDYTLTSHASGKTYRVALRGAEPGQSYCSCPDFRTNRLGTCKHILHALAKVEKRFKKADLQQPPRVTRPSLRLDYHLANGHTTPGLRWNIPEPCPEDVARILKPQRDELLHDAASVVKCVQKLEKAGCDVLVYPDAEEWIDRELTLAKLREATADIRRNPEHHPFRHTLLKVPLLPYQMDGVAFLAGAGRAVLADDMGLGKTIQGIGTAELLAQLAGIQKVLVVCPASVKSQWRDEIHRFSNRSVGIINGNAEERRAQYHGDSFFKICNYEQVMRDLPIVETVDWDLVILDEGQRIKNWESKTSQSIRSLRSPFAVVLSGTPLENRIDELYTVVKFVDEQRLGPAHQFFHKHRSVDDSGRVVAIKKLDDLRDLLRPILLRRTRNEILQQLPERTTTLVRIRPTQEQADLHDGFMKNVAQIVRKSYLTEMDLLRLQKFLLMARMSADGTGLVDKEGVNYSSKLDKLRELFEQLAEQPDRKIVLFSEWRRMHDMIEPILDELGMQYVRLDGQVPQVQRPAIVNKFQKDPECRVIMMTNAGSTGLNLQAANTVINVDLPWNPAVLEQRIARAHRMGQKNPVHVYLLVTEETIEEKLLDTLASKQELASAALDVDSDIDAVEIHSGMEELKRRVEKLLGQKPDAPIDESQRQEVEQQTEQLAQRRERVAAAGGQLVGAALQLVGELVSQNGAAAPDPAAVELMRAGLSQSLERDESGRPQLRFTLPDDQSLQTLAETFARLLVGK